MVAVDDPRLPLNYFVKNRLLLFVSGSDPSGFPEEAIEMDHWDMQQLAHALCQSGFTGAAGSYDNDALHFRDGGMHRFPITG
jgi:hypothetical protein